MYHASEGNSNNKNNSSNNNNNNNDESETRGEGRIRVTNLHFSVLADDLKVNFLLIFHLK